MAENLNNQPENHERYPVSPESGYETHEKAPQKHEKLEEDKLKQNIENIRDKAMKTIRAIIGGDK